MTGAMLSGEVSRDEGAHRAERKLDNEISVHLARCATRGVWTFLPGSGPRGSQCRARAIECPSWTKRRGSTSPCWLERRRARRMRRSGTSPLHLATTWWRSRRLIRMKRSGAFWTTRTSTRTTTSPRPRRWRRSRGAGNSRRYGRSGGPWGSATPAGWAWRRPTASWSGTLKMAGTTPGPTSRRPPSATWSPPCSSSRRWRSTRCSTHCAVKPWEAGGRRWPACGCSSRASGSRSACSRFFRGSSSWTGYCTPWASTA